MSFPVKNFNSDQSGHPTLTGEAGSFIGILDACLLNGFNLKSLDSLVVASGVATGTVSTGHGFKVGEIILVAGATPSALNGEQKVTAVTSTTFTFDTTEADTTATGSITAKIAPVGGWTKVYTGTNTAVYRSDNVAGNRLYLRVFDAYTGTGGYRFARMRGYESMTDVDTGTGLFPLVADVNGDGVIVMKSYTASSLERSWALIADERFFYFVSYPRDDNATYLTTGGAYCFGEFPSFRPSDAYNTLLVGNEDTYTYTNSPYTTNPFAAVNAATGHSNGHHLARRFDQLGGSVIFGKVGETEISDYLGYLGMDYPCAMDGGIWLAPVRVYENSTAQKLIRGRMPGLYQPLHNEPLTKFDVVNGITDLPNRDLICVPINRNTSWGQDGQALFDITGPWR